MNSLLIAAVGAGTVPFTVIRCDVSVNVSDIRPAMKIDDIVVKITYVDNLIKILNNFKV